MIGVELCPLDTWFFRDGGPFTRGAAPQDDVESLFPPYPPTVVGALRAAAARENGWSGAGGWAREVCAVLGDGPDDLGRITFDGPFLLRDGRPLFQAPRHLLGATEMGAWNPKALLRPGEEAVTCDLGRVRLPTLASPPPDGDVLKPGDDQWLTPSGMKSVLRGKAPDVGDVVPRSCLWATEPRIGLERESETRTAKEGMLYSTAHVRLQAAVSLGARISGLPESWALAFPFGQTTPLGGESRLAELREWDAELGIEPPVETIRQSGQVAVVTLTPLDVSHDIYSGENAPIPDLGGARVVSACLGRHLRIGGWNSLARRPLPIQPTLPPGSVLFCEVPEPARLEEIASADGLARIGNRKEWGFGLVVLGVWPNREEGS